MNKSKDLSGKQFGRLTAIEQVDSGGYNRHARWSCRCECGVSIVTSSNSLQTGGTKSCGCLNKEKRVSARLIDLHGKKFGRLAIVKRVDGEGGKRGRWICKCDCGETVEVYGASLRSGSTKSCGCFSQECRSDRRGDKHPMWKGGRNKNDQGYVLVKSEGHPNANSHGYVPEHQLVMANSLGRSIRKDESVHHKNGIRDDNRIENLELRSAFHPRGQSVDDMVDFCQEYLKIYKPDALRRTV